uniref:Uncharacterized protein n=1 Tax=Rhizophora mucronata TaxID=61149 RepID=A0A2P2PHQ3_RHIMU
MMGYCRNLPRTMENLVTSNSYITFKF